MTSHGIFSLPVPKAVADDPQASAARLVQGAIRLSSNVIWRDPGQFASQMVGRLLPYRDMPAIEELAKRVYRGYANALASAAAAGASSARNGPGPHPAPATRFCQWRWR